VIGFIKGKSAIHLARVDGERKRNFCRAAFLGEGILRLDGRARRSRHQGAHPEARAGGPGPRSDAYRGASTKRRKAVLRARFDRIFTRKTGFVTLDRVLARLHANKPELLMVLNRPEIPLHTNGSENDVRCHVSRLKVSGGTRSDVGRDCRDAFLGLARLAPSSESRSGITSAQDWLSQAARPSHTCRNWLPPNPD